MRKVIFRAASVVAGLALAVAATIASALPADAASNCKISFDSYPLITTGSYGAEAKAAQCLLQAAGYHNKIRKRFSAPDAVKLRKFQAAHQLSATGTVNAQTWTALLSRGPTPTLRYGDTGPSIRRLQRSLTASVRPVPVTGFFGSITQAAVKLVQSSQGWRPTGVATTGVWRVLQSGGAAKVTLVKAAKSEPPATTPATTPAASGKGATALAFAKMQLGDRYAYGGAGPNRWDCSGLTMRAWQAAGVGLPHSSSQQFRIGTKISKSELRPGDLVFFYRGISHVALYVGNGMVIHASHSGSTVTYIKMSYMPYMGARRPG
jgi:cell wall-associated NlpC family hydrolase